MRTKSQHRLRRQVHTAVAREGRLREDGRDEAADAHLAARLASVRNGLTECGVADAVGVVQRWVEEDGVEFAHAHLVREYVLDRAPEVGGGFVPQSVMPWPVVPVWPAACLWLGSAGLADLLDDVFPDECRPRWPHS